MCTITFVHLSVMTRQEFVTGCFTLEQYDQVTYETWKSSFLHKKTWTTRLLPLKILIHVSFLNDKYLVIKIMDWYQIAIKPLSKPMMTQSDESNASPGSDVLTHWGWDKMASILQTTFSNAFSWMKMYKFRLKFHWHLFLGVQLNILQHWFRQWLGTVQVTSHYLNQWWLLYWCVYAAKNSLRPGLNWFRWLGSKQATSHHLNQ